MLNIKYTNVEMYYVYFFQKEEFSIADEIYTKPFLPNSKCGNKLSISIYSSGVQYVQDKNERSTV